MEMAHWSKKKGSVETEPAPGTPTKGYIRTEPGPTLPNGSVSQVAVSDVQEPWKTQVGRFPENKYLTFTHVIQIVS